MSDAEKSKNPKFKWTKELVNIALNDGMTQDEIARVCRTQQSVVSSWKNGKNKATEQQLAELLRRYGARLNRTTARLYLVWKAPHCTWDQTPLGKRLIELHKGPGGGSRFETSTTLTPQAHPTSPSGVDAGIVDGSSGAAESPMPDTIEQARRAVYPYAAGAWTLDDLLREYKTAFEAEGDSRLVQVEGPVIFRYTFFTRVRREKPKGWEVGREPVGRWLLHDLSRGKLVLVAQHRRSLFGLSMQRCRKQLQELAQYGGIAPEPKWLESTDDAGRWLSFLRGPLGADELLTFADAYLRNPEKLHDPHDEQVLPYLLRKSLVEHGHPVPGIDRITASE